MEHKVDKLQHVPSVVTMQTLDFLHVLILVQKFHLEIEMVSKLKAQHLSIEDINQMVQLRETMEEIVPQLILQ